MHKDLSSRSPCPQRLTVYAGFPIALLLQQLLDVWGGLGNILQLPAAAAGHRLVKEGRQAADGGPGEAGGGCQ